MNTVAIAPIRKSILVNAAPERAFKVFTEGMTRWWNKQYSINASPISEIVVEARAEGRWFERGEDGSECQWGKVLAWEPPSRVLLAWQIETGERWRFDESLVTELEIRFIADGEGTTRVELEHRNLDRLGDQAAVARQIFDSSDGWQGLLDRFAQKVD
jgi:uncharacterized protein YndB with AHSA1/START domain